MDGVRVTNRMGKNDEQQAANDSLLDKCRSLHCREKPNIKKQVQVFLQNNTSLEQVSKDLIAANFHVSSRTLTRKLKEQGTSYQQLLTEERKRRCCYFIARHVSSGTDLARLLGFSEPAYFYQSFKQWTNLNFCEAKAMLSQNSSNIGRILYGDRYE